MADFLTRLAQRAQGVGTDIRPDIAPAFLHAAGKTAEPNGSGAERAPDDVGRQREPAAGLDRVRAADKGGAGVLQPIARSIPTFADAGAQSAGPKDHRGEPRADRWGESVPSRRVVAAAGEVRPSEFARESSTARRDAAARIQPAPAPADPHAAGRPEPSSRDTPTVRITIGQIEVRAVSAPTQMSAQRPAAPRASPLRSLDSYLRDRNGGA